MPGKEQRLIDSATAVRERLGVDPEGVTSFKALAGDPSDNIPGLAGIGAKTASALVTGYRDLDGVYANLDQLPARQRGILETGRDMAYLFRDIATIRTDVPGISAASLPTLHITAESRPRELLRQYG